MTDTKETVDCDVSSEFDFEKVNSKFDFNKFFKKKYYRIGSTYSTILDDEFVYTSIYDLCYPYDVHIVNTRRAKSIVKGSMLQKSDHIAELIKEGRNPKIIAINVDSIHKNLIGELKTFEQIKDDNSMVCLLSGGPYNYSLLVSPDDLLKEMEEIWQIRITEATKEEFYQYVALLENQETD